MNRAAAPPVELGMTISTAPARERAVPLVASGAISAPSASGARDAAGAPRASRTPRVHGARGVRPRAWAWLRTMGGVAILASLAWKVGAGGFLAALRVINVGTLLAACGLGLLTTVLSAWRWRLVARGLGIALPLRTATADYYRATFLNAALPGGVLGDVHRAVRHGKDLGDLGLGVRAVALERFAGQAVVVATGIALLLAI